MYVSVLICITEYSCETSGTFTCIFWMLTTMTGVECLITNTLLLFHVYHHMQYQQRNESNNSFYSFSFKLMDSCKIQ